jgi:YVTN family beta-propeller protein
MAKFTINTPLTTAAPTISVDAGLPPGTHRFQLVVQDEAGNASQAAVADVVVAPPAPATFVVRVPQPLALEHDPVADEVWVVPTSPAGAAPVISVIGIGQRAVVANVAIQGVPLEIALTRITAARRVALVTSPAAGAVLAIDMVKRAFISAIQVGGPLGVAISPDGRLGYVVAGGAASPAGFVTVIDMATLRIIARVPVGSSPTRVVFAQSGKEAYVNNTGDGTISVINVATNSVVAVVKVGGSPISNPQQANGCVTDYPVWTANFGTSTVSRIAPDHSVSDSRVPLAPQAIAVSRRGDLAVAAGPNDKTLAIANPAAVRRLAMPGVCGGPGCVALSPGDALALAAHPADNLLSLVDPFGVNLLTALRTPADPERVITTADGKFAAVSCRRGDAVMFVDISGLGG